MRSFFTPLAILTLLLLGAAAPAQDAATDHEHPSPDMDAVWARWKDSELTRGDVLFYMTRSGLPQASLVRDWSGDPADLDDPTAIDSLRSGVEDAAFNYILGEEAETPTSETLYRVHRAYVTLLASRFFQELYTARPAPTEEEIQAAWEKQHESYQENGRVRLRYIFRLRGDTHEADEENRALLEDLRKRLLAGEDFKALCLQFSQGTNAGKGGEVQPFIPGSTNDAFEAVALPLKDGELSEVIVSKGGFYLIEMIENKPAREVTLDEAREKLVRGIIDSTWRPYILDIVEPWKEEAGLEIAEVGAEAPDDLVVIKVKDWQVTLGEIQAWEHLQPRRLERSLQDLGLAEAVRVHLENEGFDRRADLAVDIRRLKLLVAAEQAFGVVGLNEPEPSEEALRAYYDAHAADYVSPEKKRITAFVFSRGTRNEDEDPIELVRRQDEARHLAIEFSNAVNAPGPDAENAVDLVERLQAKATAPEMVQMVEQGEVRGLSQTPTSEWKTLEKEGDFLAPKEQTDGSWIVYRCDAIIPSAPQSFEEVRERVASAVRRELVIEAKDEFRRKTLEQHGVEVLLGAEQANVDSAPATN